MARSRKNNMVHVPRHDEEPDFVLRFTEHDDDELSSLIEHRYLLERQVVGGFIDARRIGKVA